MFVIKRKNIIVIVTLILSILTIFFCFSGLMSSEAIASVTSSTIVLDAGHGGIDDGAIGTKLKAKESEINLAIVYFLKEYLENAGFKVILTRTTDAGLYGVAVGSLKRKDMENRRDIILKNNPSMVISIHQNKYVLSSRRGAQVFYKKGDNDGKSLANFIQTSFNNMEECVSKSSILTGDYYILNCSSVPSVLCECGFLSNEKDEALLITEEYQKSIAYAIYNGICQYNATNNIK